MRGRLSFRRAIGVCFSTVLRLGRVLFAVASTMRVVMSFEQLVREL